MPSEAICYLSAADVLVIHRDTIEHEGGIEGVRDMGLLDSAVAMPRQRLSGVELHVGPAAKAAGYLHPIALIRPFFDGNKRAAAMAALVFLQVNGATRLPQPHDLEEATLGVAAGDVSKKDLTEWMKERVR